MGFRSELRLRTEKEKRSLEETQGDWGPTTSKTRLSFFPSTKGRVLLSQWRYPVAAVNLRLSEIKIRSSKPHLWPHI